MIPKNPEESGATLHIIQFLRAIRVRRRVRKNEGAGPEESGRIQKRPKQSILCLKKPVRPAKRRRQVQT